MIIPRQVSTPIQAPIKNNTLNHILNMLKTNKTIDTNEPRNINTTNVPNIVNNECMNNDVLENRYICIKKEHFDVNMIYLNYTNLKKRNYIEIIYRSPSIFLDGLFFKTPKIDSSQISIFTKNTPPYSSTIQIRLSDKDNISFVNMLKNIDQYINNYIARFSKEINKELHEENDEYHYLKFDNIVKNNELGVYTMTFKSYLDNKIHFNLKNAKNKKYIITFNISNIYYCKYGLIPLIKCNKCEEAVA